MPNVILTHILRVEFKKTITTCNNTMATKQVIHHDGTTKEKQGTSDTEKDDVLPHLTTVT